MEVTQSKWENTANRFVAFFDIMGFKDRIIRQSHEDVYNSLKKLSDMRNELNTFNNMDLGKGAIWGESKSFTFSDSIMFFSKGDTIDDLNKILVDSHNIIIEAFHYKIPIKGALSYGKITIDIENSIYFGQPIIDAYLLHEELMLYSVIADNAFEKKTKELNSNALQNNFRFYKTPLKSGKANHYLLIPPAPDQGQINQEVKELYNYASGKYRQYIDNTIEYFNEVSSSQS